MTRARKSGNQLSLRRCRHRAARRFEQLERRTLLDGAGAAAAAGYGQLPLSFEINQGQTDPQVNFLAHGPGYAVFLTPGGAVLSLQTPSSSSPLTTHSSPLTPHPSPTSPPSTSVLQMQFIGANPHAQAVGLDKLAGVSNYLIGSDPTKWHTGVANYGQVEYQRLYAGVDLTYYGNQRQLEYDFTVAPGADPSQIAFDFSGAQNVSLDGQGNLVLHTAGGDLVEHAPTVYQAIDGARRAVDGHYMLAADGRIGFEIGNYDHRQPLVIDPLVQTDYSTYLGGSGLDIAHAMAVDGARNAYVAGYTGSAHFPGAVGTNAGGFDAFVVKLDAGGTALVYSTFLGGDGNDSAEAVAVDAEGNAYVAGFTYSNNFPTTSGAFQPSNVQGYSSNAFVAKLRGDGTLLYSTGLGNSASDAAARAIAIDSAGDAYVAGLAVAGLPTTAAAVQASFSGGTSDAFVTELNPQGSGLVYSTYLGGGDWDSAQGIAIDGAGNAFVTGYTYSNDFPTTSGSLQSQFPASSRTVVGFVSKLNPTGTALFYSTYLGGNGATYANRIAVDVQGDAFIAGSTTAADFPATAGAFQASRTTSGNNYDAFVSELNPNGTALVYSTYLGGSAQNSAYAISIDAFGQAFVAGVTSSTDFPTTPGAPQGSNRGGYDAFVAKLNATGTKLLTSTYLGGTNDDYALAIAVDASENVYVAGYTGSTDFPTGPVFYQDHK